MKDFKTQLIIKTLIGAILAMFICLFMIVISSSGDEVTIGRYELVKQFVGSALMGGICMGSSVVYEIESWGLWKVTLIHYVVAFVAFLIACIFLEWFPAGTLIIALIAYTIVYACIWLFEYTVWKREIRNINRDMDLLKHKAQESTHK